ncbi:N-acetyltransferase [Parapedobacter defluvii]|uniref:N-acetyltransferase n=1 Tax=Parapedobacter defluvii TaxID=2045106 RepID=A0ABQ1LV15_9SPHI|nr:GNAT family N-acetyltransferase [Parapedobacter defluvii]GGC30354.1 N-acetyltransferase [Parapedobacter defluvii]
MDKSLPFRLRKLSATEPLPMTLLLLADETTAAIEKYIHHSDVYVAYADRISDPIAICALFRQEDDIVEIKNIAVNERYQGQGIGSWLLSEIKQLAREAGYKEVVVGTADAGYRQHSFYLRNGFVKSGIRKNFFIENYPEPIFENGLQLKDMILFKASL